MAVLKSNSAVVAESGHYLLEDFETQKRAYFAKIEKQAQLMLVEAAKKAQTVHEEAKKKGLDEASAEIEKRRSEAVKKGEVEGLKKGEDEARRSAREKLLKEAGETVETLKRLAAEFETRKEEMLVRAEAELVRSAIDLARAITLSECDFNPAVLEERLKKALAYLRDELRMEIRVNPADLERAQEAFAAIMAELGHSPSVEWRADPTLGASDAVVSAGLTQVDLRSQLQWERLLAELRGKGIEG